MSMVGKAGYKETAIGWIPKDWDMLTISHVGTVVTGNTPPKSNEASYGDFIPWVSPADMGANKYVGLTRNSLSEEGSKLARILPKGSVLVTCIASLGKNGIASRSVCTNQQINALIARDSFCNEYTYYCIEHHGVPLLQKYAGRTAVPIVSKGLFEKFELPYPSKKNEQEKIAAILSVVDDKLDVIARQIDATNTLKRGLMQTLFSQGVGTQDANGQWLPHTEFQQTELGEIPTNWRVLSIAEVLEVMERPVVMAADGLYRRVTVKRRHGGVELRDKLAGAKVKVKSQFALEAGDFLISERQIVHGACGIVPESLAGALVSNEYLVLKAREGFDTEYFNYLVQLLRYAKLFLLCSQGVDIEKFLFKPKDWLKKKVPVPPYAEQCHITAIIKATQEKVDALTKKQTHYQILKRGLMQKLLTGEWRVKVA